MTGREICNVWENAKAVARLRQLGIKYSTALTYDDLNITEQAAWDALADTLTAHNGTPNSNRFYKDIAIRYARHDPGCQQGQVPVWLERIRTGPGQVLT